MNVLDSIDSILLNTAEKVGRFYQNWTGKNKSNLVLNLYITAGGSGCVYGLTSMFANDISGIAAGGMLAMNGGFNAMRIQNTLELTEKIPSERDTDNFSKVWYSLLFTSGIASTVYAVGTIIYSVKNHDYKSLREGITIASGGISLITYAGAAYLERVNIEPPTGKTIPQKIREYVTSLIPKPVLNPGGMLPIPA